MSSVYLSRKQFDKALESLDKAIYFAQQNGSKHLLNITYENFVNVYRDIGNFKKAFEYQEKHNLIRDSIFSESKVKQLAKLQTAFDTKQKEQENELLKQENLAAEARTAKQIAISVASILAFLVISVVALFLQRSNRQKQLTNNLLDAKNTELEQQQNEIVAQRDYIVEAKEELEKRNLHINKSLYAALAIQQAMLPQKERIQTYFEDYFILFKPKDVVSGDFYWIEEADNKIVIALLDCTGHGVPGAFMSMIGHTLLDRIVMVNNSTDPSQILEQLHEDILTGFKKHKNQQYVPNYGMDAAIVVMERQDDGKTHVHFSGAKRSLYFFQKDGNHLQNLKANRISVGSRKKNDFTTQEIILEQGYRFYLFTDGITDQNNLQREKLGTQRLLDLLEKTQGYLLDKQKMHLEEMLNDFMLATEQRDDILVMGFEV